MGSKLFCIILLLFVASGVAAQAESSNFSVKMYTLGVQGSTIEGDSLSAKQFLTAFQSGTNGASNDVYIVNIGFFGNATTYSTVSIDSYSISPRSSTYNPEGVIVKVGISANKARAVWLRIMLPNGSGELIDLNNDGYAYYTAYLTGRYNITFYANHSSGAIASAVDYFYINSPVQNPSGGQEGGGGGGGGSQSCKYIWDCDPWSVCSADGKQVRVCRNTGTCTGTEGKPVETRNCSESLFDVILDLSTLEITMNETLTFNVDLTQTKSVDKIDVQIKYSIIDWSGREVFTQVETRAVESNINYQKILDELRLPAGSYKLVVDILYGNLQRANAEQTFTVTEEQAALALEKSSNKIYFLKSVLIATYYILLGIGIVLLFGLALLTVKILGVADLAEKAVQSVQSLGSVFSKPEADNLLSYQTGKKVYSEEGMFIGKVSDIYVNESSVIYGWVIKVPREIRKKIGKKKILIRQKHVISIKDVVIIDECVRDFLYRGYDGDTTVPELKPVSFKELGIETYN